MLLLFWLFLVRFRDAKFLLCVVSHAFIRGSMLQNGLTLWYLLFAMLSLCWMSVAADTNPTLMPSSSSLSVSSTVSKPACECPQCTERYPSQASWKTGTSISMLFVIGDACGTGVNATRVCQVSHSLTLHFLPAFAQLALTNE